MTFRMADGPVANLPPGLDAYAGYVNDSGIGETYNEVVAKFPNANHLSITTNGSPAKVADVERGAMHDWRGYRVGYCAVSEVNNLVANYGRPQKLWTAHYDPKFGAHICSPACWPGLVTSADGTQWTDHDGSWDESLLSDTFFGSGGSPPPSPGGPSWAYTGDVPAPTDVVDSWSVPGSSGLAYVNLHADGGLFAYGNVTPSALDYIAESNDGGRYEFGPGKNGGVLSYPGLPASERQGSRYFVKLTALAYQGKAL
jgi:hypothetical protein